MLNFILGTSMPGLWDYIALGSVFGAIAGLIIATIVTGIVMIIKKRTKPPKFYILLWVIIFLTALIIPSLLLFLM